MAGAITNRLGNIGVMPLSSMRQADGMFDIAFAANDIRKLSVAFYNDGICPYTDDLSDGYVSFVNGFTVRVNPFRVNIDGTLCFYDDAISLTLEDADPTLPRIDSIIIRRDLVGRRGDLLVKTGVPAANAVPPELVYNRDGLCEFLLANIYVTPGVSSLAQSDITDWRKFMQMKIGIEGNVPIRPLGSMEFSGFTAAELPEWMPGWYFMNGDFYPNTSKQAIQLNKLPTDFKKRWGIINNGSATCVPNFFYEDGPGYMVKGADGVVRTVGSVELDAMPEHRHKFYGANVHGGVTVPGPGIIANPNAGLLIIDATVRYDLTSAMDTTGTGAFVLPLNIAMTPVIFLAA